MIRTFRRFKRKDLHSPRHQIILSLILFFLIISGWPLAFVILFPVHEGEEVTLLQALIFVFETITRTGYGEFLPFHNEMMTGFTLVVMISGVIMFLMIINLFITPVIQAKVHPVPPCRKDI